MEFISETKAKIRLATLLKWHERVEEQKQKPKKQEKGFISRQMEYYAWKHRAYIESLSISQENQDHGKITRYMKSQDNQLPWERKKSKDDAIKRWVISQEKYVPLRSNEMPSYVTLDKSQSEDEAQESHSETSSFGDYINISSKNCVRKLSDLKLGDFKFGDLKLGGEQPEETPNNQYKGTCTHSMYG